MYLNLRNKYFFALIILISLSIIILLINPDLRSEIQKFSDAEKHFRNWEIVKAKNLIEDLLIKNHDDYEYNYLYARVLFQSGELFQAREAYKKLLKRHDPDSPLLNFELANIYYFLGKLDSSYQLVEKVIIEAGKSKDLLLKSRCLNLFGLIAFNRSQYKEAYEFQSESLQLAKKIKSINEEANALRQLGVLEWYSGKTDSVITKYYQPALKLYRLCNNKKGEATTISNIGLIYGTEENWILNMKYQLEALSIRKKINDQIGLADSYYFTGFFPFSEEGRNIAFKYLTKSYKLSRRIGYAWGEEVAARSLKGYRTAAVDFQSIPPGITDVEPLDSFEDRIQNIWREARLLLKTGDLVNAGLLMKQGILISDSLNYLTSIEGALTTYADIMIKQGNFREAEKTLDRVFNIIKFKTKPIAYTDALSIKANLLSETGKVSQALNVFSYLTDFYDSLSFNLLNKAFSSLTLGTGTGNVRNKRANIFKNYIRNLIKWGKYKEAFSLAEKEKLIPYWAVDRSVPNMPSDENDDLIRNLGGLIDTDEEKTENLNIGNKIDEIYESLLVKKRLISDLSESYFTGPNLNYNDVMNILNYNEAFLEFFIDDKNINVFVLRNNEFKVLQLDIPAEEISSVTDILVETVFSAKQAANNLWKKPAEYLYSALIEPLRTKNLIKDGEQIFISPHKFLYTLPFQMLLSKNHDKQKFFIEENTITYVPSAAFLLKKRTKYLKRIESVAAFAPLIESLPYSGKEINAIKNLNIPAKMIFENSEGTSDLFLQSLSKNDIVHLASHGRINKKHPLYSYFELSDKKIELREILETKIKAQLIILSACETGYLVGEYKDFPSGYDGAGFTNAFLTGGSSTVISPLWLVQDKATSVLISSFYKYLSGNLNNTIENRFSIALAMAQRKYIQEFSSAQIKPHPFYWAAFFSSGTGE